MSGQLRPLPRPPKPRPEPASGIGAFLGGSGLAVVLTLAVVVGLQLGALPWRFRRELWQLQGALAGGLVGYLVGWSVARVGGRAAEGDGEPGL